MRVEIVKGPGSSAARVTIAPEETCVAEGGAMIAYRGNVEIQTATHERKRSIMRGLKRLIGGESFFLNYFTAHGAEAEVMFAATLPGDMLSIELGPVGIVAEGGSFVVRSSSVELDTGWQGLKSVFSGESLFWLKLRGSGTVVYNQILWKVLL